MNSSSLFKTSDGKSHFSTFALVCTLFLLWGFCNGLIDILNKHFQETLHISKMESGLVQFANYMGYFFMAIPSGLLARRFGYKGGILLGLGLIALGAFWFVPATQIDTYWAFLTGLFVLATGLTLLETIANPYTTVLGPAESGATRINLAQTCNAVGWILGPLVGGQFVLSTNGQATQGNGTIYIPYLGIGLVVLVLIALFFRANLPDLAAEEETIGAVAGPGKPLYLRWHFTLAVVAQFLYVSAQTGIFSFFVNYVTSSDMPVLSQPLAGLLPMKMTTLQGDGYHITSQGGSILLSLGGFVLFLLGRFFGSLILRVTRAHATLAAFAVANALLMVLIVLPLGWVSVAALFLSFFFLSIMYPTIFALGIRGLGEHTKFASSLIVMSIVGGAIMPPFMGWLADTYSMRIGFYLPLVCFVCIAGYAFFWPKLEQHDAGHAVAD